MKILLTGMTGFAGRCIAEKILSHTAWDIVSLERITNRPEPLQSPRIQRMYHDFRAPLPNRILDRLADTKFVIHAGAEVHGLRSLENPELFVQTNLVGTYNLLEACRIIKPEKFIYVSSGEAVGSCKIPESLNEDCLMRPSNPYAAAKGAAELLCRSYHLSFGVPAIVIRTMNLFGPRQDTSKFVPATVKKILNGEVLKIHVNKLGIPGSRHWLHIREFVQALGYIIEWGNPGETYHVVGPEKNNQEIVSLLVHALHTPAREEIVVPGNTHDMRYSIRDNKIPSEIYQSDVATLEKDLAETALAYRAHEEWLR